MFMFLDCMYNSNCQRLAIWSSVHLKPLLGAEQQPVISAHHQGRCVAALGSLGLLHSETYLGITA